MLELAVWYQKNSQLEKAENLYSSALKLEPNNPNVYNLSGMLNIQQNNYKKAATYFEHAINLLPGQADLHDNLANAYYQQKLHAQAIAELEYCIQLDSGYWSAYIFIANIYLETGDNENAIKHLNNLLLKDKFNSNALVLLAKAHFGLKQYEVALEYYERLNEKHPDDVGIMIDMGIIYQAMGQYQQALASYNLAIEKVPQDELAYLNRSQLFMHNDQFKEALADINVSINLNSNNAVAYNNLGTIYQKCINLPAAIQAYKQAISLKQDYIDAHINLATAYLKSGDFNAGWEEFEWRLYLPKYGRAKMPERDKLDTVLQNKTVLVTTEQGHGDTFQFIRFLNLLKQTGCNIILETSASLVNILCCYRDFSGIVNAITEDASQLSYDYCIPTMSLPYLFTINLDNVRQDMPYFLSNPEKREHWQQQLKTDYFKVGIAWSGNSQQINDRLRSTDVSKFLIFNNIPNLKLYSLQWDESKELIQQPEYQHKITDLGCSWEETAAIIDNLDLVITVDTAVAHLAGSMNKEVWVLLPYICDWRWFERTDESPWYPSMRLFRQQSHNNWQELFERVEQSLRLRVNS